MGPKGLKTLRIVAGVVVEGIDPIHNALVGVDCTCDSIPPRPALLVELLLVTPPGCGEMGLFMLAPLAGAIGALSAFPKPIRTVWPLGIPMFPPRRLRTSSLARIASAWSTKFTKPHSWNGDQKSDQKTMTCESQTFSGRSLKLSMAPYGAKTWISCSLVTELSRFPIQSERVGV